MKRTIITIISGLILAFNTLASGNQLIDSANAAYSSKDFQKASDYYQKVVSQGFEAPELFYNLANAEYKLGNIAPAILYYEKALKLKPGDDDIRFNLALAKNQTLDKFDAVPELFFVRWYHNFQNQFSSKEWGLISIFAIFAFFTFLLLYRLTNSINFKKASFWISIFLIFISIIAILMASQQNKAESKTRQAIIFTPTLNVKSSPDEKSETGFVIHEGLKIKLLRNINDWYEIRVENGNKGWVKKEDFREI